MQERASLMIRMNVPVFSDAILKIGRQMIKSDSFKDWKYKLQDDWDGLELKEKVGPLCQKVRIIRHVHPGAKTTDLVRDITDVLNGTNPDKFHGHDIIFMSMSMTWNGQRKMSEEIAQCRAGADVQFANRFPLEHRCFCGPIQERTWCTLDYGSN